MKWQQVKSTTEKYQVHIIPDILRYTHRSKDSIHMYIFLSIISCLFISLNICKYNTYL